MTLTPAELRELTGHRRSDAQARALRFMGIPHSLRPNGSVVVLRAVVERALGSTITPAKRQEPELMP